MRLLSLEPKQPNNQITKQYVIWSSCRVLGVFDLFGLIRYIEQIRDCHGAKR